MKTNPPDWAVRTRADQLALETCYWDEQQAGAVCKFAETLFRSQYIVGPLKLLEWQRRLLMSLYGWRNKSDGSRRFRFANLHCSKKNGG